MCTLYASNQTLQELDSILKPLMRKAMQQARQGRPNLQTLPQEIAHAFKREIDNTRTALSEKMYHIDMAMNGYGDRVERARCELMDLLPPDEFANDGKITREDYVRESGNGYIVFDGWKWVEMPATTEIRLKIDSTPESNNKPAVHLFAYDAFTQKRVTYIDDSALSASETGALYDEAYRLLMSLDRTIEYTDPMYNYVQSGGGSIGTIAGTVEAFSMSQHYRYGMQNPFNGGSLIDGKWKALDGQWHNFREIEQAENAFTRNSLKTSKYWAETRGAKAANAFKWTGRICFVITASVSAINIGNAYMSNDSNRKDVYIKNSLDITMGIIAFVPGFGWAISGTYFLMDAGGAFGNWGQLSGYSQQQMDAMIDRDRTINRRNIYELDFDIEYQSPIEQIKEELQRETRTFEKDNTFVNKPIFKNFH